MGGTTGNIRTLRNQSGTVGSRTLASILTSGNGGGAGSGRRVYGWYNNTNPSISPYTQMFNINFGQFKSNAQFLI